MAEKAGLIAIKKMVQRGTGMTHPQTYWVHPQGAAPVSHHDAQEASQAAHEHENSPAAHEAAASLLGKAKLSTPASTDDLARRASALQTQIDHHKAESERLGHFTNAREAFWRATAQHGWAPQHKEHAQHLLSLAQELQKHAGTKGKDAKDAKKIVDRLSKHVAGLGQ